VATNLAAQHLAPQPMAYHTIVLHADGSVWTWGNDGYGQLGDGTVNPDSPTPTKVSALDSQTITEIAAGRYYSIALDNNADVWTWGRDQDGQLGDGTVNPDNPTPTKVSALDSQTITEIAAGRYHSIALDSEYHIWTWGSDSHGQLGDGTVATPDNNPTPSKVQQSGGGDFSLPVELSSFTATAGDGQITLRWVTQTEVANFGFAIYRSEQKDGKYTKIGFVYGAGNSVMPIDYQFTDEKAEAELTYFYYLEDIDISGEKSSSKIIKAVLPASLLHAKSAPIAFCLLQNYPNPFNPDTWIPYELAKDAPVSIQIYNIRGQLVRQMNLGEQVAGSYVSKNEAVRWDGRNESGQQVASGVYWYRLQAGDFNATRRMVILK